MMLPMSIRCNSCGTYIYKGTKFNARKEDAAENYLGIRIVRLYFRCTQCASELAIKTDPKNSDYVVELGATRNYEPWREREQEQAEAEEERKRDEEVSAPSAPGAATWRPDARGRCALRCVPARGRLTERPSRPSEPAPPPRDRATRCGSSRTRRTRARWRTISTTRSTR